MRKNKHQRSAVVTQKWYYRASGTPFIHTFNCEWFCPQTELLYRPPLLTAVRTAVTEHTEEDPTGREASKII